MVLANEQVKLLSVERGAKVMLNKRQSTIFGRRCRSAGIDPREVVTAVFEQLPPETCLRRFNSKVPPPSLFVSGGVFKFHRAWRQDRIEMRLQDDPRFVEASLVAEIRSSEHRLQLMIEQGVAEDDAIRVGIMTSVIRPVWLLAHPNRGTGVDLDGSYDQADLESLEALKERKRRDAAFARALQRAVEIA